MNKRRSGILLHITSLPGSEGIGTLGSEAFRFVDFLKESGQKLWQILPLGPAGSGNSPYQCYSAFAGNPLMIDLHLLVEDHLLEEKLLEGTPHFSKKQVDFDKVENWKMSLLRQSFTVFIDKKKIAFEVDYWRFLDEHSWWLNDHALFMAIRKLLKGLEWGKWEREVKFRYPETLSGLSEQLAEETEFQKYLQFIFFRQWHRLKEYANHHEIQIVGDVPLYVSGDSSDLWANTDIFLLDADLNPTKVGGVPPDYFSETGQLWGNPVFDWQRLSERNYDWWVARIHFNLRMFDLVRIDHFRGLESFWAIPADENTAINGQWVPAHGRELLRLLKQQLGQLNFIAEDLGTITPEVDRLREEFNLPGMKVLQFAFTTGPSNKDLPHNYEKNTVVYTGTHDNDTTLGWLKTLESDERKNLVLYTGEPVEGKLQKIIGMAIGSVAETAIIPMQDVLELGSESRMNTPGTSTGNWRWRFQWSQLKAGQIKFLEELTKKYNR